MTDHRAEELRQSARSFTLSAMNKTGWSRHWRLALARFFSWGLDLKREIDEIEAEKKKG